MPAIESIRRAFDPRSLRGRLTLAYASALVAGLLAFAIGAFFVLKAMERASLDVQLRTAATALAAIVETRHGEIVLEHSDRAQFFDILGLRLSGAIFSDTGKTVISNVASVPAEVRAPELDTGGLHFATLGRDRDRIRVAVVPVFHHGTHVGRVVAWRPSEWFGELDTYLVAGTLATMLAIVLPSIAAGAFIAGRGLQPLERIADVASEIEARDLALRLDDVPDSRDELSRLATTFNRMLDRLQTAFDRERRFTADASHELRAPLSVIAAETSLALRRERSPESYRATLRTIADVVAEIETLAEGLLAAARSESGAGSGELIELASLARATLERIEPLASERGVALEGRCEAGVAVFAERASLARALLAVLHNALKFSPRGGRVQVDVGVEGDEAIVRVADDGPGFSPDGLAHALERFWRADPARSPGTGAGLGLAIARSIVERAAGRIELANAAGGGALVTLRLPRR